MTRIFKWVGLVLGSAVALALIAATALYIRGSGAITEVRTAETASLQIPTDSSSIARGAHLAGIYGCVDCHGDNLAGTEMGDAPPFRLVAGNLTPGGLAADFSSQDWDRAIRHGVGHDGRALFVMPSGAYNKMSDADAADLIAYLQTLPPVENDLGNVEWKPMGKILAGGPMDLASLVYTSSPPTASPAPDSTAAWGGYVAGMMCAYCHGDNLEGKLPDGSDVYAPDLRASGQWTPEQFHQTMSTGESPGGHQMDPEVMPWTTTARMTQTERESLRLYLASLGPAPAPDA